MWCCVFFGESHCQGCVKWWQRASCVAGVNFVTCAEKWRKLRTKHRFWGSHFWCSPGKLVSFGATKCEPLRKHRTKCSFSAFIHVSSRFSGFLVASLCLWGKLQTLSTWKVSNEVKLPFCVAGVALCVIATCFTTCQKSFCAICAIRVQGFQKMLHFSWQAQHFGDLHRHFAWQAQHLVQIRPVWKV